MQRNVICIKIITSDFQNFNAFCEQSMDSAAVFAITVCLYRVDQKVSHCHESSLHRIKPRHYG